MLSKKNNILLIGFPKSGTTWATRLIGELMECPVAGYWGMEGGSFDMEGSNRESEFAIYKSHHHADEITKVSDKTISKIIYIVRDPRDVVVSGAYHFPLIPKQLHFFRKLLSRIPIIGAKWNQVIVDAVSHERKIRIMSTCLQHGDLRYKGCHYSWEEHIRSYRDKEVLFIRYEDLLDAIQETSGRIASFLEKEVPQSHILKVEKNQSFENQKTSFLQANELDKYHHLRKGKSGLWKDELPKDVVASLEANMRDTMQEFNYI